MSKRQEKLQATIKRQQDFISARRQQQLIMLEQAYEAGLRLYEENKDKLSPEDVDTIEKMKIDQLDTLEKLRLEAYPRTEA